MPLGAGGTPDAMGIRPLSGSAAALSMRGGTAFGVDNGTACLKKMMKLDGKENSGVNQNNVQEDAVDNRMRTMYNPFDFIVFFEWSRVRDM